MPSAAVGKALNVLSPGFAAFSGKNSVFNPVSDLSHVSNMLSGKGPHVPPPPIIPPAANPASLANSSSAASASNVGAKAAAALAAQNGGAQFGGSATSKASLLGPS